MAKRKRASKRAPKHTGPQHSLPGGFWQQVGAVLLIVLAILVVVAIFGAGGPLLEWFYTKLIMGTIGWAVYILPAIAVYLAVETFRAEKNKLPVVMRFATFLFLALAAGFLQLFTANPLDAAAAQAGNGGGVVGWTIAQAVLSLLEPRTAGFVLAVLAFITSLFIVRVNPMSLITSMIEIFKRETATEDNNRVVAAKAAGLQTAAPSKPIGELKLNAGVPTTMMSSEKEAEAPVKRGRLSSFKNSAEPIKKDDDSAAGALVIKNDPNWENPSLDLLEKKQSPANPGDVTQNAQIIHDTLSEFGIEVSMEGANIGPKVTQYTLKPPAGVKLGRITALETNIALNLAASAIRMEAPIPGQQAVGIEVPNRKPADVRLFGILMSKQWKTVSAGSSLSFAVGKDIAGEAVVGELDKMPHLLIAGQTGSGKSVMINTLLTSLLYHNAPNELKLILVDPKQVEMTAYSDIPHLLSPVITEPEKCISALKWAVNEMERRYTLLAEQKQRNIKGYNDANKDEAMPYIVIVIDELADLMMLAARDVEALIVRLAQKARAIGIHLVLATQTPRADVVTGLIKANVPARIAFTVAGQIESRIILDQNGAEKLLGYGDMLMTTPTMTKPRRIQGAFVSDEEVIKVTDHIRLQRPPEYDNEIIAQPVQLNGRGGVVMDFDAGDTDAMYRQAVEVVVASGKASASLLQRRLRLGYARAARIIETMEERGIVGPADGARPREVLISSVDDAFATAAE